ncbi:MAG: hypothetical protein ACFFDI_31080, partial [Promethearchaeota archaeon]
MEAVDKLAADFQIFEENSLFDEFLKRINQGSTDVAYGLSVIKDIANTGAIETLILLDSLLKGAGGTNPDEIQNLLREVEK